MSGLWDTFMNIEIFAFIALLVWLYLKPSALGDDAERNKRSSEE